MMTRLKIRRLRSSQRGVSIIAAIFLLLLFAALAAFMTTLTTTANVTSAQDMQGIRAYQAAQAGVEWGLFQLDPNDNATALPGAASANCQTTNLNQIPGFSVLVTCNRSVTYTEGATTLVVYQIIATASATGAAAPPAAAERQAEARIAKCQTGAGTRIFNC